MTSSVSSKPDKETMLKRTGHTITALAFLLPSLVLGLAGYVFGTEYTGEGLAILWPALLFSKAVRFRRKKTFLVVERFGLFWDIKFAGFCILIPFIDNPVLDDDFLQKQVDLFVEDGGENTLIKIDFTDGISTDIPASAWYQIGDPADIESGNWDEIHSQVLKYTYLVKATERSSRVAEMFQTAFLRRLEKVSYKDAREQMEQIAEDAVSAAKESLKVIGVFPFPGKGIVVKDAKLPEEILELRRQVLRGEMDAQEAVNRSRSYWQPLIDMKKGLRDEGGFELTDKEILEFFTTQKGFEVLAKAGKLDFVAPGIDGAMKTINVGATGT